MNEYDELTAEELDTIEAALREVARIATRRGYTDLAAKMRQALQDVHREWTSRMGIIGPQEGK